MTSAASSAHSRHVLLINPNTSAEVTARLQSHLRPQLPAGMELIACTAAFGAPYIACESSHAVAAHAVLQAWAQHLSADAVLIGCFGDPGLFALREQCAVPVTGLAEAAFIEASAHGSFAVVTGGARWKPMLERLAQALGYGSALTHIETMSPSGAPILADPEMARAHLIEAITKARATGARAVIIGGAGLVGWASSLQPHFDIPLVDSVEAGLRVLLEGRMPAPRPQDEPRPELVQWLPNLGP
jgi:Asp/Glu/hydantoin racemase